MSANSNTVEDREVPELVCEVSFKHRISGGLIYDAYIDASDPDEVDDTSSLMSEDGFSDDDSKNFIYYDEGGRSASLLLSTLNTDIIVILRMLSNSRCTALVAGGEWTFAIAWVGEYRWLYVLQNL